MPKYRKIRVRGSPRKDPDPNLLVQAVVLIGEAIEQQQRRDDATPTPPQRPSDAEPTREP